METKNKLVPFQVFSDAIQAHMLFNKLDSEGIECYLYDENIVSINPFLDAAVGGIKVMIKEEDLEKATLIYNSDYSSDIPNDAEFTKE